MVRRSACRLLIIDDGADDRLIYRFILNRQTKREVAITLTASGEEGLAALQNGTFDCMLLDYTLPDMTGTELLDQAIGPDGLPPCPTVIVTGNHDERIAAEARRRGVGSILLKDEVDDAELMRAIDAAMAAWPPPVQVANGVARVEAGDDAGRTVYPLSIAAAKQALAASFGVAPDNVEITIRG